jgi:phenylalanyl-tRNA synthetase alpha subunit
MLPEIPTLEQYLTYASELEARGIAELSMAADSEVLEEARIRYLGDKRGELLALQKALATLPPESRRDAGRAFNDAKTRLNAALEERRVALAPPPSASGKTTYAAFRAARALSASAPNACGTRTARSARIFRSISIPARPSPLMNTK